MGHTETIQECVARICRAIESPRETTSLLVTGADMNNLSIQERSFREMRVVALVTAGVLSNAVRMAEDTGRWYEPGTINIILLTNTTLSPRAMTRAIISATEAKTAALWDMDIRSAETGRVHPATGTGTDNILVVQGTGLPIDNTGGHTKMGELIARAVYAGVQEAVRRQNGLTPDRHVFHRLHERHVTLFGLADGHRCGCDVDPGDLARELEHILLDPRYAGFVETALALSDRKELAAVADLGVFETTCHQVAEELAGRPLERLRPLLAREDLPPVLTRALNALANGAYERLQLGE
jgi:adenosylcobinamide amidohydrolase